MKYLILFLLCLSSAFSQTTSGPGPGPSTSVITPTQACISGCSVTFPGFAAVGRLIIGTDTLDCLTHTSTPTYTSCIWTGSAWTPMTPPGAQTLSSLTVNGTAGPGAISLYSTDGTQPTTISATSDGLNLSVDHPILEQSQVMDAFTGTITDYTPQASGVNAYSQNTVWYIQGSSSPVIHGMVGGTYANRRVVLVNVGATSITLVNLSASGTNGHKFFFSTSFGNQTFRQYEAIGFLYDTTVDSGNGGWRMEWTTMLSTVSRGGTGLASLSAGSIPYGNSNVAMSSLAIGSAYQTMAVNGAASAPVWFTRVLSAASLPQALSSTTGQTGNLVYRSVGLDQATYLVSGRSFRIHLGGTQSNTGTDTGSFSYNIALCSVSGCGSGTVAYLASYVATNTSGAFSEAPWDYFLDVQFTGASAFVSQGHSCTATSSGTTSHSIAFSTCAYRTVATPTAGGSVTLAAGTWYITPIITYPNVATSVFTYNLDYFTVEILN